jgi:hypothetical protein
MIASPGMDEAQRALVAQKRAAFEKQQSAPDPAATDGFPPGASLCLKCNTKAMVMMDGCQTCLSCGYSKCG